MYVCVGEHLSFILNSGSCDEAFHAWGPATQYGDLGGIPDSMFQTWLNQNKLADGSACTNK